MAHRNRNIQSTSKESVQIQTDAVLVTDQQLYGQVESVNLETHTHTHYSSISTHSGLLRPFSDKYVYRGLQTAMQEIREFTTTGETDHNRKELIQKRLCSLEQEIGGLLKRDLLVTGKEDDYYKILSDKDSEITHVEFKTKHNFIQLEQMRARIRELEDQIVRLNRNVKSYQIACEENQHYRQYFEQLKNIVSSNRGRPKDLEKLIDDKIIPEMREFEINFSQITTRINKNVKGSVKAKNLLIQHIRDIEKLFSREELTESGLEEVIESFYVSNTYLKGSEEFERRRFLSEKVTKTEEKYQMLVSVLRDQVEKQKKTDTAGGFFELEKLLKEINVREGVQFVNCNGWVGIGKIETQRTVEIPVQDVRTKQLITLLGLQMKKITERYPKLKEEISVGLRQFLELQILEQAVEVDSLDRIKQIIVYHNDIVRVDNVYSYSSEKDKQLIYHLRVLIKTLLEELQVMKTKFSIDYTLDEGILGLLKAQVLEGIDIDAIISLYRPLPKTIEVEKIIEKPVYVNGTLEKGIPIRVNKMQAAQTIKEQAVEVVREVPVFIEVQKDNIMNKMVEVAFETEKVVQVPTIREFAIDKVLVNEVLREIQMQKIIAIEKEIPVQMKTIQEVIVQVPRIQEVEKPVPMIQQKLVEVELIKEVPVYLYEKSQKIKEIEVTKEKLFREKEYHQIERMIPHIINTTQVVNIEREVPVYITNTEEKPIQIREIVEKAVPYRVLQEKIVELPLIQEKEVIKEIEKEILVDVVHFVKGDREEVLREVQVRVEKPIIHERIVTKDVEVEKMVPLYIREEKPVICQIMVPYQQVEVKIINNEVVKMVPVKEEVIKEVEVETPVPVIVQKQIVKVETVIVEKIVQKIVEVPRVVEIEKIVQKIVVVPRIIQEIVQVPRIVEKVVVIETPVLQIVEVIREVPVVQNVQVIKEVIVPETRVQIVKEYEVIEKEKLVQITVESQIPKEVYLQKRIPIEVLREVPQEIFIDKLVDRIVEINEVTVKDREVPVIVTHQEPVPMLLEKPFITQKIIENIVQVETVKTVEVPILRVQHTPKIVEVVVEKAVVSDIVKQVPGPQKIIYNEVPVQVQVTREVVVEVEKVIEQPKEVYLTVDKVVHQIHDKLVTLPVTQMISKPEIIEVNKPKHFIHYKEVPVHVPIDRQIPVRSVYDQPKYVQLTTQNNVVTEVVREKTKEIVNEIKEYLTTEVVKEVYTEKPVLEESLQIVEVKGDTELIETHRESVRMQEDHNLLEKVVERIIMLPQIVEVVKHVHDVAEVQSLGIASNVEIETHTNSYIGISTELRKGLADLMEKFKVNAQRQPDLRVLITVIEKYIGLIDNWIRFPKIIEVTKEIEKIVEKEKVVLVPTEDKEKNATLSFIVEQLIIELRRVKDKHRIELNLDENITNLFFSQNKFDMGLVSELTEELKRKHEYFGSWSDSHPFIVSAFLEEHFTMKTVVDEANLIRSEQEQIINELRSKLSEHEMALLALRCGEEKLKTNYKELVNSLKDSATRGVGFEEIKFLLDNHEPLLSSLHPNTREVEYSYEERRVTTSITEVDEKRFEKEIGTIMDKLSHSEREKKDLLRKLNDLERENQNQRSQLDRVKASKVTTEDEKGKAAENARNRMQEDFQRKLKNLEDGHQRELNQLRTTLSKDSNANTQLINENKRVSDKIRQLEREIEHEKRNSDNQKKQHERELENQKKQQERGSSQLSEVMKNKIVNDYERKLGDQKNAYENEITALKMSQGKESSHEIKILKDKIKKLEIELESSQKQVAVYQKSGLGATTYGSGSGSHVKYGSQIGSIDRYSEEPSEIKSPKGDSYKSGFEKQYISPSQSSVRSGDQQISSVKSHSEMKSQQQFKFKAMMTMREFMNYDLADNRDRFSTLIMIKIVEKIESEVENKILNSYTPNNIYLIGFDAKKMQNLGIKFGAPITNRKSKNDGMYLSPEVHSGNSTTTKSIVFTLGVIWDELLHHQTFFKTVNEIEDLKYPFKMRDTKLNPVLKNTLFEMMNKDPVRRIELGETKRRISLHKYIASETRVIGKKKEDV